MNLSEAYAFVSHCMALTQVHRLSGKLLVAISMESDKTSPHSKPTAHEEYTKSLQQVIDSKPLDLELLALLGGLYREAYLACALEIALILKRAFKQQLENYCQQQWLSEIGKQLSGFIENKLLYWRIDRENLSVNDYDTSTPEWAIERPLFVLNENNKWMVENQDQIYSDLMDEFIEAITPDSEDVTEIKRQYRKRFPNLF